MVEKIKSRWRRTPLLLRIALVTAILTSCGLLLSSLAQTEFLDADEDGMPNSYEEFYLLDRETNDAFLDYDDAELSNLAESLLLNDPFEPDTDRDGFSDDEDAVPISRAYIQWGDPSFTDGDFYEYAHPAWFLRAYRNDGEWVLLYSAQIADMTTSQIEWVVTGSAWHAAATNEPEVGSLSVDLDRSILTNNLVYAVHYFNDAMASLYVDLLDTNGAVVAEDLYGNLMAGTNANKVWLLPMPLIEYPDAAVIHLRRGLGAVTVYEGLLYIDEDMDGLDADQERQFGTSDYFIDTDEDGVSDYDECFSHIATTNGIPSQSGGSGQGNVNNEEQKKPAQGVIYVDQARGDDNFTGRSCSISGTEGPKKTVRAGLSIAGTGDTLIIKSGVYNEDLNISGKRVTVLIEGKVKL